ncbi:ESPR domain-containing protein [Escherichia coli]|nr:hypothetical protein [Escherichia coli]EFE5943587.1 hypothetical protein [Escherichia coli]EII2919770.1 ESPR domain-containing protein [Escherichia coli]EKJ3251465.1 ESPR domain-containing protein [Escherichia coli]EKW8702857.1 ESPR domain-containing protein [Escherichia coli]
MNKIYSLKFCYITKSLIVVSELAHRVTSKNCRKFSRRVILSVVAVLSLSSAWTALAATVSAEIPFIRYSATLPRIKASLLRGARIFPFTTSRAIRSVNLIKPRWLISVVPLLLPVTCLRGTIHFTPLSMWLPPNMSAALTR